MYCIPINLTRVLLPRYFYFSCPVKSCGDPGIPRNGNRSGYLFNVNNEVRYSCNTGFSLNGPSVRVCQANQTWTETTPKCKRKLSSSIGTPFIAEAKIQCNKLPTWLRVLSTRPFRRATEHPSLLREFYATVSGTCHFQNMELSEES